MSSQAPEVDRRRDAVMTRVRSQDGTEIAYWTTGDGPPLLLVHGTTGVHERFAPLVPYLEPHATVHAMDRRGRGASGDAPNYALEREYEDVAAVIDAIAESSGAAVDVYGHSYGGECAFGAALITPNIRSLVLYEGWPPVSPEKVDLPREVEERLEALVAAGDREAALEVFMRDVAKVSDEDIHAIRAQPTWPARIGTVHTITREIRAFFADTWDPAQATKVSVPVLVLTGADSPDEVRDDPETVAGALPDARLVVIEGQQHLADVLVPEIFAEHLLAFLRQLPRIG
ncbi:MAG: alpha/beta fold hydrolase [Gaiellales bacterium]